MNFLVFFFVKYFQPLQSRRFDLLLLESLVEISPLGVGLFSLDSVGFICVILSDVLPEDQVKLFKGSGFTDSSNPQEKDGEVRILEFDLALGVVLNKFFHVHKAELVDRILFGSHRVHKFPR